jgi:small subunit ribosomal protein S6
MRTYELVFIADPRLTDEETVLLADGFRDMLTADGATKVTKEESWGKRKLAYPIEKMTEGRYHLYFIEAPAKNTLPEVEQRMRQNDKILRHLVVRTDLGLKRAETKGLRRNKETREPARAAS